MPADIEDSEPSLHIPWSSVITSKISQNFQARERSCWSWSAVLDLDVGFNSLLQMPPQTTPSKAVTPVSDLTEVWGDRKECFGEGSVSVEK